LSIDGEDDGEPGEIDTDLDTDLSDEPVEGDEGAEEGSEESGEVDVNNADDESSEETSGEERDEFGQIKKKKKPVKTEESVKQVGKLIQEANMPSFSNAGVQAIADILSAIGIDLTANRSFQYQANQLISKNGQGIMAVKQSTPLLNIKRARDSVQKVIQISPGNNPSQNTPSNQTTQTSSFELLGNILAESKWSFASTSAGTQLSCHGIMVKLDEPQAKRLKAALKKCHKITVDTERGKVTFDPTEETFGDINDPSATYCHYKVYKNDEPAKVKHFHAEDVAKFIKG
jgi:hypothetical protein